MENDLMDSLKSGLNDYIDSLINIYSTYLNDNGIIDNQNEIFKNIQYLNGLKKAVIANDDINALFSYRSNITKIEELTDRLISENQMSKLTNREKDLVVRDYDVNEVIKLATFTEKEARDAAQIIFDRITKDCERVDNPICIFLGGQPGCGKSSTSARIKDTANKNGIVEIGIDNYRTFHPRYLEMEDTIKKHWENRTVTENDSPGNDIADFTHNFAGRITDILIEMVSEKNNDQSFNIVMEWGMRTPEGPLECMKDLKKKGYTNTVDFIAVHKDVSLEACKIRADIMNNQKHIVRRVPNSFHELAVSTIADSADKIYEQGFKNDRSIDQFIITDRSGKIIFDHNSSYMPSQIYNEMLNNPNYSISSVNDKSLVDIAYINETYGFEDENNMPMAM